MRNYIFNGVAHGDIAQQLQANGGDVNAMRPYIGDDGRSYTSVLNVCTGEYEPVLTRNDATTTFENWRLFDTIVAQETQPLLTIVNDLKAAGMNHNVPNGFGKSVFSSQKVSDPGSASTGMEPAVKHNGDRPEYGIDNVPLAITWADFSFTARELAISQGNGGGIDTSVIAAGARRVAEEIDKMHTGVASEFAFGGGTLYGLANFPTRQTKVITAPGTPSTTVNEVLEMIELARLSNYFGPFMLYYSTGFASYMDRDYLASGGNNQSETLRTRLKKIEKLSDVKLLNYLTGNQLILVQMNSSVMRTITGMPITTVQWGTQGGMVQHYKIMGIQVPQPRATFSGKCGIVHGATA